MRYPPPDHVGRTLGGFSLVEVVLAIGIVAFALLSIIGLFGGVMKSSGDNSDRREKVEAVDSLRAYLNEKVGFSNAFDLAAGTNEVLYLTYAADENGVPQPGSGYTFGFWTNSDGTGLGAYEQARSGRWLRARLSIPPSNSITFSDYSNKAVFVVNAEIRVVATPGQTSTNQSLLTTTMAVRR